jgi:predicted MFS family arabinose efflux permease
MVAVDLARVPVALLFITARGPETLWIAFVAVVLLAVGASVFEPTSSAALPNVVEPDDLAVANVLIGAAWGTMLAVGAGLGGAVAVLFGRDAAFIGNAASFAISALLIVGIRVPLQQPRDPADVGRGGAMGVGDALVTAVRFARGRRTVSAFLLSKTTFGVGMGVVALLAVFGRTVFAAGDAGIGLLFAARGLGALIGPFLIRPLVGSDDAGLIRAIGGSILLAAVCYAIFPLAPTIWLAAVLVFAAHCGGGTQWTLSTLGLQRSVPDAVRGRVFSVDYGLVTLTVAGSTALGGLLADTVPPQVAVWTMVALMAAAGGAWIAYSRPAMRRGHIDEATVP